MKSLIKAVTFFIVLICLSTNSIAQFVQSGTVDIAVGSGATGTTNTGNDIINYLGDPLIVSVWDATNGRPGISWECGTNVNFAYLQTTDAYDTDVSLISDGNVYYAVVVYHSASSSSGSFMVEYYTWSGTTMSLTTTITNPFKFQTGKSFETAINVDGNLYGHYGIVWDQDSSGVKILKSVTGRINGSSLPELYVTTPFSLIPNGTGAFSVKDPDVCLWDSTFQGTELMYVSYLEASNGKLIVQAVRWDDVNNHAGTTPTTPEINYSRLHYITPTYTLSHPRIACANGSSTRYNLTVVAEYINGSLKNIVGYTYNGGLTTKVYTDGTYTGFNTINAVNNLYPVVTYDNSSNNKIFIAWNYDNTGSTYGANYHPGDKLPIGVQCDVSGTPAQPGYWDVPRNISGNQGAVSICGKNTTTDDIGLTWFDDVNGTRDVNYKWVSNTGSSFRNTLPVAVGLKNHHSIQIIDVQGRLILQKQCNKFEGIEYLKNSDLKNGIYFIKEIDNVGSSVISKFVKS